jgi:hypothetical protein
MIEARTKEPKASQGTYLRLPECLDRLHPNITSKYDIRTRTILLVTMVCSDDREEGDARET